MPTQVSGEHADRLLPDAVRFDHSAIVRDRSSDHRQTAGLSVAAGGARKESSAVSCFCFRVSAINFLPLVYRELPVISIDCSESLLFLCSRSSFGLWSTV